MIDLPTADTFFSIVADPRFPFAVGTSILAGVVRGFSGFGSALIFIPLMSAIYSPQIAAATFVVIDLALGMLFAPRVWKDLDFRQILPLAAASIIAAQFGALILIYTEPNTLRWTISALVALVVVVLASGWRYHGRPILPITIVVGLFSGFMGGAVQLSGPPIIIYWLGSAALAKTVRANFIVYFTIFSAASFATYAYRGLVPAEIITLALLIGPLHIASMAFGSKLFARATEKTYRRVAYGIVAMAALASMPLWDQVFR